MPSYQTTPLAQDLYSRFMVSMFDEHDLVGVTTAFQSLFGRPETNAKVVFSPDANDVDIDMIRVEGERLAPLIPRGSNARPLGATQKNIKSQKFTNINRVYPLIEEEADIEASKLTNRMAGENPYEGRTQMVRLRAHAARNNLEMVRRILRTREYLAAQSILTAKMPAILGTAVADLQYDFGRNANHSVTLGTTWASGSGDPLGDLDDAWDLIRQNAHVSADMILAGEASIEAYIKDTAVQTLADNRRFEIIQVNQNMPVPPRYSHLVNSGWTARGVSWTPKGHELWWFTNPEYYTNSAGTATKYMPAGKVVVGWSGARNDVYHGPPELLPMTAGRRQLYQELFGINPDAIPVPPNVKNPGLVNMASMYFDAYASNDWKSVTTRVQAAPIFANTMTDAYVVIENAA